jgi:hypothetical protein
MLPSTHQTAYPCLVEAGKLMRRPPDLHAADQDDLGVANSPSPAVRLPQDMELADILHGSGAALGLSSRTLAPAAGMMARVTVREIEKGRDVEPGNNEHPRNLSHRIATTTSCRCTLGESRASSPAAYRQPPTSGPPAVSNVHLYARQDDRGLTSNTRVARA